ncbi:diacetyl reductase [Brevibacillus panacihumi W25]|uniref:Diacetyl reductase n=1 Tax=Brevibacillus panacihumi W25 TaxID=1408254 RepID=V6MFU1_9BACL|nr:SDR family NAD(P)-dependent oxidoreductase [Brevibacillus panacihumi]EST54268.1 diacetyl reductase [Brevibacillus panacihumi W25]
MSLEKKVGVITGAARGLGYSIAEELASSGHIVHLLDRDQEQLQASVDKLRASGYEAYGWSIDLADPDLIPEVIMNIVEMTGNIDVLVNNAGVNFVKPIDQVTSTDWDFVLDINLKAVFFMIQAAAPQMREGGSIINIASIAANSPRPLSVAYAASKAGVLSLTKTISIVLAPRRIRVNAICPGAMDTELLSKMAEEMSSLSHSTPEQSLQNYLGPIPLGRISEPTDVAKAVSFLASDAASYVTGQSLNVCGGVTVQ